MADQNWAYHKRRLSNKLLLFFVLFLLISFKTFSQEQLNSDSDDEKKYHFTNQLSVELGHGFILSSAPFYKGDNENQQLIKNAFSGHIRYSLALPKGSLGNKMFPDTYQGLGLAYYNFDSSDELGTPYLVYLFQRSKIADFTSKLRMDYEWNFGLSMGWNPYDSETNPANVIIGSKVNAYINLGLYLNWEVDPRFSLTGGADFTHFSNGNTDYPNAGLNAAGYKIGAIYNLSEVTSKSYEKSAKTEIIEFPRHLSYDVVLFGSWRRKGVDFSGEQVASPHKYAVIGGYFAPMYNFGYRLRAGFSLDMTYDGSANVYTEDYIAGTQQRFYKPGFNRQVAVGISARGEYIMPLFTISAGIGTNILHRGGDLNGTYQSLALKVKTSRKSFLHIGYNLKDFYQPNYLMLGIGYRLQSKTPPLLN